MITLQVVQVLLGPVPGQVLGLVSGYLFGVVWGTFYSVVGNALGTLIAVTLARAYGRPLVERLVSVSTLARVDAGTKRRGLLFFFLVFLLPFVPDDLICLAAGLTRIPIPALILATLAGRSPGIWVSCWLGANAGALTSTDWAFIVLASALMAVILFRYGPQLQDRALRFTERVSGAAAPSE
jgi:uncharacterized membrane protein YdjX (TVP38/TMEM64 family)